MYLTFTSHALGLHLAHTSHAPHMYLALGVLARRFIIHHSSFYLRPALALGSHWGGFGVALGWL
jgi:hypothetical protein